MGETFVQKAADGSVYKLWHHFNQSVKFHKPWKDGRSVLQYKAKQDLILISKKMFFDIFNLDVFVTKEWQYRK